MENLSLSLVNETINQTALIQLNYSFQDVPAAVVHSPIFWIALALVFAIVLTRSLE